MYSVCIESTTVTVWQLDSESQCAYHSNWNTQVHTHTRVYSINECSSLMKYFNTSDEMRGSKIISYAKHSHTFKLEMKLSFFFFSFWRRKLLFSNCLSFFCKTIGIWARIQLTPKTLRLLINERNKNEFKYLSTFWTFAISLNRSLVPTFGVFLLGPFSSFFLCSEYWEWCTAILIWFRNLRIDFRWIN